MRIILLTLCLLLQQQLFSQYKLRIETSVPSNNNSDSVFIAGNFNGWQPSDKEYMFVKEDGIFVWEKADVAAGFYEYKFTSGSWNKVETSADGSDISNRTIKLSSDTIIKVNVAGWKTFMGTSDSIKLSTASKNVQLLDSGFLMKQLNRNRRIWIYLPPGYHASVKKYPVVYMHDGQNLFDNATSAFGEWGIDEILDSLAAIKKATAIVVGIDNGPMRMNEYNPYYSEKSGQPEGNQYLDFIMKDLKPFIDKKYRTLSDKENTIIAGSSMGGLISYYAALKYNHIFGRAGVFSPSFWIAPQISSLTDSIAHKTNGMFFFYAGEKEGDGMIEDMNSVIHHLGKTSSAFIYTVTDPDGIHNEAAWKKWFAEFFLWVTSNGHSYIVR